MVNWHQHTVVGVLLGWVVEHLNPIEHVLPCSVACGACPPPNSLLFHKVKEVFTIALSRQFPRQFMITSGLCLLIKAFHALLVN
jgi:hypothetical protein